MSIGSRHVAIYTDDKVGNTLIFIFKFVNIFLRYCGNGTILQIGAVQLQIPKDALVVVGVISSIVMQKQRTLLIVLKYKMGHGSIFYGLRHYQSGTAVVAHHF